MNNTKSSMIDMKPKYAIKLDNLPLDKTYREDFEQIIMAGSYEKLNFGGF